MARDLKKLFREAFDLPESERATLAGLLIEPQWPRHRNGGLSAGTATVGMFFLVTRSLFYIACMEIMFSSRQ